MQAVHCGKTERAGSAPIAATCPGVVQVKQQGVVLVAINMSKSSTDLFQKAKILRVIWRDLGEALFYLLKSRELF